MTVPVWVKDPATGEGMRIVGDIGITSPPQLGDAPEVTKKREDSALAGKLTDSVITPFISAWGDSDSRQLNLVLADDATVGASTGLGGTVTTPRIASVRVFTPKAVDTGSTEQPTYVNGDTAIAEVLVEWAVPISESTQVAGYRVSLVLNSGKWMVRDIEGGLHDPSGAKDMAGSGIGKADDLVPGAAGVRETPAATPSATSSSGARASTSPEPDTSSDEG